MPLRTAHANRLSTVLLRTRCHDERLPSGIPIDAARCFTPVRITANQLSRASERYRRAATDSLEVRRRTGIGTSPAELAVSTTTSAGLEAGVRTAEKRR